MNKIIKYFSFITLTVIMLSCNDTTKDVVVFELSEHNFGKWKDIIRVESIHTFEQNDSCLLSYADKCIVEGNYIFFDDHKAKAIYQFSKDGKLIRKIGSRGKSSSEYIDIMDFNVNASIHLLTIMDERGMICYDVRNGNFVTRKKFNSGKSNEYDRFYDVGKDCFLCTTDNRNDNSIILDSPNTIKGLRTRKSYPFIVDFFYRYNNSCYVVADFGNFHIDKFEDGKLIRKYEFDLCGEELPEDALPKNYDEFEKIYNNPEYFKCITRACESPKWLNIELDGPKSQEYTAIINKKTGKYVFGTNFPASVFGTDGDIFYSLVYPAYLPENSFLLYILKEKGIACDGNASPVLLKFSINEKMLL